MKDLRLGNENQNLAFKNFIPVEINKTTKKINKTIIIIIFLIIISSISILLNLLNFIGNNNTNPESLDNTNISEKLIHKSQKVNDFLSDLNSILDKKNILLKEIMSKHTTFRLGGPAKYFIKPKTIEEIVKIINLCKKYNIQYFILGNGSNLLVSDDGYDGVIIHIHEDNFGNFEVIKNTENNYTLKVGGGILMKTLAIKACLLSLEGLEDIIDIPGTVGGGIIMNASFRGRGLRIPLSKVKVITPEGNIIELTKEECGLRHRWSILKDNKYLVIEASFNLVKGDKMIIQKTLTTNTMLRYKKQPMYFGSAGCFFAWNHSRHGGQYEKYKELGIVGYKAGDAMIYTDNIAFIVNLGNAKSSEVYSIVTYIEKLMKDKYKINTEREVIVIGSFI